MKKLMFLLVVTMLFLVMCKKNDPIIQNSEDQPITISIEIDGKQSQEVRIK